MRRFDSLGDRRRTLLLIASALLATGCAQLGGAVAPWVLMALAGLVTFACISDTDDPPGNGKGGSTSTEGGTPGETGGTVNETGGTVNEAGGTSVGGSSEGTPSQCCVDGRTSTCICPPLAVCNFTEGVVFLPGRTCCYGEGPADCTNGGAGGMGGAAGAGGAGGAGGTSGGGGEAGEGTLGMCCENGMTEMCLCPPGVICNFGLDVEFHPDGTCCELWLDAENACTNGGAGGGGGSTG